MESNKVFMFFPSLTYLNFSGQKLWHMNVRIKAWGCLIPGFGCSESGKFFVVFFCRHGFFSEGKNSTTNLGLGFVSTF